MEEDDHRFIVYPGLRTTNILRHRTLNLEGLLRDANRLTRRRRYLLALTLASSFFQLGSTPWLSSPLNKENIVFLEDPSDAQDTALDVPYIRREMSKNALPATADVISSLGLRLLELCFGVSIENTKFRKQLGAGDDTTSPLFDLTAAYQWSKEVGEEAGPEFAEAIHWCLHARQLSDGNWRKDIWTNVIVPLDSCYQQVC
jgi:hypothetical protein